MRVTSVASFLAAAAFASAAMAQPFTNAASLSYSLSWQDSGNHNGILEPGEGAVFTIGVSFTNQNTVASFSPSVGTYGSGTIRGFGGGFIDLIGTGNVNGTWDVDPAHGYGVVSAWDITSGQGDGTPLPGGTGLSNLQFGQFPITPANVNTTNPIAAIWTGIWVPNSYAVSQRVFTLGGAAAANPGRYGAVDLEVSPQTVIPAFINPANLTFGQVTISIPGPGAVAPLALAGLAIARRRRK